MFCFFFFFNDTATTEIYTLSLHDALPILDAQDLGFTPPYAGSGPYRGVLSFSSVSVAHPTHSPAHLRHTQPRSEEHTSELQSPCNLVCRLLLEKKNKKLIYTDVVKLSHIS